MWNTVDMRADKLLQEVATGPQQVPSVLQKSGKDVIRVPSENTSGLLEGSIVHEDSDSIHIVMALTNLQEAISKAFDKVHLQLIHLTRSQNVIEQAINRPSHCPAAPSDLEQTATVVSRFEPGVVNTRFRGPRLAALPEETSEDIEIVELDNLPNMVDKGAPCGNGRHLTLEIEATLSNLGDAEIPADALPIPRTSTRSILSKTDLEDYEEVTETSVIRRLRARLGYKGVESQVTAEEVYAAVETSTLRRYELDEIMRLLLALQRDQTRPEFEKVKSHTSAELGKVSIGFRRFVSFCVDEDKIDDIPFMDGKLKNTFRSVRDVLLASDVNCLVAELMSVRVDDLASPQESPAWGDVVEPIVGCVICLNGIVIGLQADPDTAKGSGMLVLDVLFTTFFLFELIARLKLLGFRKYYCGPDYHWNIFDTCVVILAVLDTSTQILPVETSLETSQVTIIRLLRLTRLTRLVRIFRLRFMDELTLMVKGLFVGLRTLLWACVLLFMMVYVISVFLTLSVGNGPSRGTLRFETERHSAFSTVPRSMFTTFKCLLIVECATNDGGSLLNMLFAEYGWLFAGGYVMCFLVISVGVMNLIMAIYIDNTICQAKVQETRFKNMRNRDSIRVAKTMKELVLKLYAKQKSWQSRGDSFMANHHDDTKEGRSKSCVMTIAEDTVIDDDFEVSREVFFYGIQDPEVQELMDELDIPPERASLFDVLDADSSGQIHATELVNGLLKVRGDTQRSDIVAPLIAIRALQQTIQKFESACFENHKLIFAQFDKYAPSSKDA
jgi:hypothetical protein